MTFPCALLRAVSVMREGVAVLDGIDLRVPLDRRVVLLGPNGAGKTTLLRLIQGLQRADAGNIAFEPGGVRPRLAYVFQKPVMLRRSAAANIEHALAIAGLAPARRPAAALAALQQVGLAYAAQRPARGLSGGEQQRLALARAQALDPVALLLDEPTASLDPGAAAAIERELMRMADDGIGFVMATHDLAMARRVASDLVFMHRGRVIEAGTAERCFGESRAPLWRRFLEGAWLE